ncbi:hypothetical protein LCGC14_2224090, partial [marine sediment metagenome]
MRDHLEQVCGDGKTGHGPSRRRRIVLVVCGVGLVALVGFLGRAIQLARQAAVHSACTCRLAQMQVALHNYHYEHGHFPPAYLTDDEGTPIHSWRVLILPYMEEDELYDAYSFDEPWNGPNNIRLANRMPAGFHCFSEPESNSRRKRRR